MLPERQRGRGHQHRALRLFTPLEPGEPLPAALRRELMEELALDVDLAEGGELLWMLDQMVTRPGPTPPPRKLHLVHRFHISPRVRARLATE
ncbi:NUDIX domain-containing protein [Streptomyces lasiicapitis]|uniref:NUDIX domain-containing protein n=1 Tax=Streptomyces TaxID=1883 RepID=UPI001954C719|nr:NUDIX domain-containing protein [Streptomyces aureoverticillatus]